MHVLIESYWLLVEINITENDYSATANRTYTHNIIRGHVLLSHTPTKITANSTHRCVICIIFLVVKWPSRWHLLSLSTE